MPQTVVADELQDGSTDRSDYDVRRMVQMWVCLVAVAYVVLRRMQYRGHREGDEILLGNHLHVAPDIVVSAKLFVDVVNIDPPRHNDVHHRTVHIGLKRALIVHF